MDPIKHNTIPIQSDQWGNKPINRPMIGTIGTYKLVKKPAFVALVETIPSCWKKAAKPRKNPSKTPKRRNSLLLSTEFLNLGIRRDKKAAPIINLKEVNWKGDQ